MGTAPAPADLAAPKNPSNAPTSSGTRLAGRAAIALVVGLASAAYVFFFARSNPEFVSDFDQVWAGAAALWRGDNPYEVIGPKGPFVWRWPLYYPLPALIAVAPLGLLPVVAARMLFAGLSAALLAFAITRDDFSRWPVFISVSFMVNVELVQWSSLLAAAVLLPGLGWISVAKPNIGVALAAAAQRNRDLAMMAVGAVALLTASFVVRPDWVGDWLANVRSATHFKPLVLRPGGFLLLLALLRWRRPEARLLVVLACIPITSTFYDPVLLFLVTRTFREALLLAAGTMALYFVIAIIRPGSALDQWATLVASASVWLLYIPCLIMVLRRPNEGRIPEVLQSIGTLLRTRRRVA